MSINWMGDEVLLYVEPEVLAHVQKFLDTKEVVTIDGEREVEKDPEEWERAREQLEQRMAWDAVSFEAAQGGYYVQMRKRADGLKYCFANECGMLSFFIREVDKELV